MVSPDDFITIKEAERLLDDPITIPLFSNTLENGLELVICRDSNGKLNRGFIRSSVMKLYEKQEKEWERRRAFLNESTTAETRESGEIEMAVHEFNLDSFDE